MDYNIYIKLTNQCNLKCKHCYNAIMKNNMPMSNEILDKTISWVKNFKIEHQKDDINISLHGGEPMLYDLDKVSYLIDSLKDIKINWCVTTNLIYEITDKHLKIFNNMKPFGKSMILTSYDFGDTRFDNNDKIELWKNNVRLLKENDIEVQPIICLTKYVIDNIKPQEIFDFISSLNLKYFNFERITETGRASIFNVRPSNKDLNEWLYNAYLIYEKTDFICPLFEGIEKSIDRIFLGCRARQCMYKVITINPDGSIAGCPNQADKTYSNIDENITYHKYNYTELFCEEKNVDKRCYMCQYYMYCNGDCFQLKWDNDICPAPRKIYEHLLRR